MAGLLGLNIPPMNPPFNIFGRFQDGGKPSAKRPPE
jgi:hypothetical protein